MKKKQRKVKAAPKPAPKAAARKRTPDARSHTVAMQFPVVVHIAKAGDRIPKTVGSQAELDRLIAEHGAAGVEVSQ